MLRSSSTLLLSLLGLTLAASTIACSGSSASNNDVDAALQAVKKSDGTSTGNGKTCSWSGVSSTTPGSTPPSTPTSPPVSTKPNPGSGGGGGSSGGCATDANGTYQCWSYDTNGNPVPIRQGSDDNDGEPIPEESSSGWSGSSSSSGGSSSGSSGSSSGGCKTDDKGNTECWTDPSPPVDPPVKPIPMPTPEPEQTFQLGEWFPSLDGCNKCTCTGIGIMCTVNTCSNPPPVMPPPAPGCIDIDGKHLAVGERYKAGCNSCSCAENGEVQCTTKSCEDPKPEPPVSPEPPKTCFLWGKDVPSGDYKYTDGCNTCTCSDGVLSCTKVACDTPKPQK